MNSQSLFLVGWVLYFVGSVGYFVADFCSLFMRVPDWLYLFLALWFVADALVYLMSWYVESYSRTLDLWAWTELMNVAASCLTALSAGMFLWPLQPHDGPLAVQTFLLLQSCVAFTGLVLFLFNALMGNSMYHATQVEEKLKKKSILTTSHHQGEEEEEESRRPPSFSSRRSFFSFFLSFLSYVFQVWLCDVDFMAELLNTLPALGYLSTGTLQLLSHLQMSRTHDSASSLYEASARVLALVRNINIAFDVMYVVDAWCYGMSWGKQYAMGEGGEEQHQIHDAELQSTSSSSQATDFGEL